MTASKSCSVFDLPPDFFDSCCLHRRSHASSIPPPPPPPVPEDASAGEADIGGGEAELASKATGEWGREAASRWTCNTCGAEFESLQDQRSHFKSDLHRLNVKLSIAGKHTIKEEHFGELDGDSLLEDLDVSSISGSEDEFENESMPEKGREGVKQKLYFRLHLGEVVSLWRCLLLNESEDHLLENNQSNHMGNAGHPSSKEEGELINRLKALVHGPRDKSHIRIVLLVSGGHFAGCVFDGKSVIAHKTFHRYVVRAKAGKKQSAKDATGKAAHSAGSSLRRYNEAALKLEIQELLLSWKPFIDLSECIFIYAPAKNRQMLFDVEKPQLNAQSHVIRYVPFTVHRPTLKEAQRIYNLLTYMTYEVEEGASPDEDSPSHSCVDDESTQQPNEAQSVKQVEVKESISWSGSGSRNLTNSEVPSLSTDRNEETPLHDAAKSGDVQRTMELLEQGLNPCIRDARGRTPYMLATEKEVRNTFRRFMALNLDKWDWHAANVPSPLTKEMEESQAVKQAEKDAKRKAKAKELKKLRKAKEKAKAQAASSQNASSTVSQEQQAVPVSAHEHRPPSNEAVIISREEEQKRALAAEREKRAAAAERRIAALNARSGSTTAAPQSSSGPESGAGSSELKSGACDITCSCRNTSLAGKVPFHRYHYKYCSTSCMHVHREMLEDG